ncbi:hypothetical protein N7471_005400 [Penicillium samsonianum]|uniref:uncharacterized protein n=1 Tax=Penicillium samsonianum TaxID=1882272 RepID=UPI002546665C|nr:uncharacterized protein N7471_005400 [Penicillium samsonianum]KAJ6138914.1 hypothetical protein N7471_005400 [Penicillium samsonianum]
MAEQEGQSPSTITWVREVPLKLAVQTARELGFPFILDEGFILKDDDDELRNSQSLPGIIFLLN